MVRMGIEIFLQFKSFKYSKKVPAFGYNYMKNMVPLFVQVAQSLINKWTKLIETGNNHIIDIHSDMTKV